MNYVILLLFLGLQITKLVLKKISIEQISWCDAPNIPTNSVSPWLYWTPKSKVWGCGGGVNLKLPQTKIYTHSGQNGDQTWLPLQSVDIQESTLGKGLLFLFSLLRAYTEHIFTCIA